jgi:glycosyltransferase involved in cell wall biosynthesis
LKTLISCSGKFHAFALAEQLQKHGILAGLYTSYAWQKDRMMRRLAKRVDTENIDPQLIRTNIPLAVLIKTTRREFFCNDLYDRWVAQDIAQRKDYDVFIGWSGMSLRAVRVAKQAGKITILERGSSHILYQNEILKEEYSKFGIDFSIDGRVIEKELQEYEECDFISIPSNFVKNSFLEKGVAPEKLVMNPYGASRIFQPEKAAGKDDKFRVLYLGGLTIRKGLKYFFEALSEIKILSNHLEIWFIGNIADELKLEIERQKQSNWGFWGHIPQHELPQKIAQCDVAVQPSLEEGLSMVIPQMLGCGVPVIASTNTGGADIIREGDTGFIVPVRSPEAIAEKIMFLYQNPDVLTKMKSQAAVSVKNGFTWDDYGERYVSFLKTLT